MINSKKEYINNLLINNHKKFLTLLKKDILKEIQVQKKNKEFEAIKDIHLHLTLKPQFKNFQKMFNLKKNLKEFFKIWKVTIYKKHNFFGNEYQTCYALAEKRPSLLDSFIHHLLISSGE